MDLSISSEKLDNPLLVVLLRKLTEVFSKLDFQFFVIGATARDIVLQQLAGTASSRKTRDLDISIAIPNWDAFGVITEALKQNGFKKDAREHQRFYYGEYILDIVPYGVAKEDDRIYWPPEEDIAMSVKGFAEVLSDAITVTMDNDFSVKIASLHGLFLLKFNAWLDRHLSTSKDADDMSFILSNYFDANMDRGVYQEVYEMDFFEEFDVYVIGAYWLAYDLCSLLSKEQIAYYRDCINTELIKEEESDLINQILDSNSSLKYEQVRRAWQMIADIFQKSLDDGDNSL
jgi:predicted nucleotidyltransferase